MIHRFIDLLRSAPFAPYMRYYNPTDEWEIWGIEPTDGSVFQITNRASGDYDNDPDAAPDGSAVAYEQILGGGFSHLVVSNRDGSGETVIDTANNCQSPNWSPAGGQITYRIANQQIWVINPDGTGKTNITPTGSISLGGSDQVARPTFNRDGTLIAFQVQRASALDELWVCEADGTNAVQVVSTLNSSAGNGFSWAHTSDRIAYTLGGTSTDVRAIDADGTNDGSISDGGIATGGTITGVVLTKYAWAPDDSKVFAVRHQTGPDLWTVWSVASDGSGDAQLALPTEVSRVNSEGRAWIFGDRLYTISNTADPFAISVALDGTDQQTHDGDGGTDEFIDFEIGF